VFDAAERQVNAWLGCSRFFGNFVFEVPQRWPSHDEQTSGRQSFREYKRAILRFQTKQPFSAQTYGGDDRSHFRFGVCMQTDTVISVLVEITKNGVVSELSAGARWCKPLRVSHLRPASSTTATPESKPAVCTRGVNRHNSSQDRHSKLHPEALQM